MQDSLNTIGTQTLTIGEDTVYPTIPIGTKMAFVEVEATIRYSVGDHSLPLWEKGGALLQTGTKLDLSVSDLFALRMQSGSSDSGLIHITYLG